MPNSAAVAAPAHGLPPEAITLTNANCDAPVNMSSESAQVCAIDRPAVTEIAPNDSAYAPVAMPMPRASRTMLPLPLEGRG